MNNKLIFLHLPKNGGSTFKSIIERYYPTKNTFSIKVIENIRLNTNEFISLKKDEKDKICLLTGHMQFGLHKQMSGDPKYVTFLRKPEERIVSFYYYVLNKPEHRLFKTVMENNMSLYDFAINIKQGDVNNCQIRWISGIDDREELMLEKALENIEKHFSFIGLTEKFDESLILLKRKYNWSVPYYHFRNKTENKQSLKDIDNKTLETINNLNKGDNLLYDKIKQLTYKQIDNTPLMELDLFRLSIYNKMYNSFAINTLRKVKNIANFNIKH